MVDSLWATVNMNFLRGRLSMHQVPRDFFDLMPGIVKEFAGREGPFWVKDLMLAGISGKPMPLAVYCTEPPSPPAPLPQSEGSYPARSATDSALSPHEHESAVERTG